jgi:pimeloyl-ACP methyl ester carboxylesterase
MPKIKTSGIEMYYESAGEGEPVVLVTGYGADSFAWALQTPVLSENYKVYIVDNRGVGDTDKPAGPYTIKMMANDLAGFFRNAGIEKAHLVGHSMGGMIAQQFALSYPRMLRSLTLASTTCRPPRGSELMLRLWADILEKVGNEAFVNNIIGWCFTFDFIDSQYDALMMLRQMSLDHLKDKPLLPDCLRSQCAAIVNFDVSEQIQQIKIPTMVLVGEKDILTPPDFSKAIAERMPRSRLQIIEGGHAFNSQVPAAFNQALLDFFREHE